MNKLILAATVLAVGSLAAFDASAQRYEREGPRRGPEPRWEGGHGLPPAGVWRHARPYDYCVAKARRLNDFELRHGVRDRRDALIMDELRADLRASCGGGRWHHDRGWYY